MCTNLDKFLQNVHSKNVHIVNEGLESIITFVNKYIYKIHMFINYLFSYKCTYRKYKKKKQTRLKCIKK